MMKIVIFGVGAMGCLFAARLTPLARVTMIGRWPQQLQVLQTVGLRLEEANGRSHLIPVQATHDPTQVAPADLALILVKSHQTEQVAANTAALLSPNGLALTLQNGLGNREKLTAVLPPERVIQGVTSEGATLTAPGHVYHAGPGVTHLAHTHPAVAAIAQLLNQAGFPTHLSQRVDGLIWGKLAVNAGINPLTALLGVPNGFLVDNAIAQQIMAAAARETAAVAQALGISLPYADAAQQALAVAQATATNHSSMLQDVLRGAPTEIEAICGAVVAHGRRLGLPTPINYTLRDLIRQVETGTWQRQDITLHFLKKHLLTGDFT